MQVNGVRTGVKRAAMGPEIISSSSIDPLRVVVWVQGVSYCMSKNSGQRVHTAGIVADAAVGPCRSLGFECWNLRAGQAQGIQ